jgi:hypothetical protein
VGICVHIQSGADGMMVMVMAMAMAMVMVMVLGW